MCAARFQQLDLGIPDRTPRHLVVDNHIVEENKEAVAGFGNAGVDAATQVSMRLLLPAALAATTLGGDSEESAGPATGAVASSLAGESSPLGDFGGDETSAVSSDPTLSALMSDAEETLLSTSTGSAGAGAAISTSQPSSEAAAAR